LAEPYFTASRTIACWYFGFDVTNADEAIVTFLLEFYMDINNIEVIIEIIEISY